MKVEESIKREEEEDQKRNKKDGSRSNKFRRDPKNGRDLNSSLEINNQSDSGIQEEKELVQSRPIFKEKR